MASFGCSAHSSDLGPGGATVVRVVDGDTLIVDLGGRDEKVRLIGIDTPETVDPRQPVECFGKQASDHLKKLLPPGTAVRLERDAEERDRYGRLLAYVHRLSDQQFINLALVRDGFANQLTIAPNVTYTDEFRRAERAARAAGSGLWSACQDDLPTDPN
jgi:micrococcal nuclease